MKFLSVFALMALYAGAAYPASQANIDTGRGDVPVSVPEGYSSDSPAPLVVLLHGYTSSGVGQEFYMKFSKLVDEYGFLYVRPNGTKEDSEAKHRFWNANEICCDFYGSGVDDSAYILGLIQEMKRQYGVDENRIYLIGHSNGGFMSHRMAYDHPDTIAGIASLNGSSLPEMIGPTPERPVNILHIHGSMDKITLYEGGEIRGVPYPGAEESLEKWVAHNGMNAKKKKIRKKIDLDTRIEGDETSITRFDKGASVELWTINGGGHVPAVSKDFSRFIIEWLLAHPKAEQ